jgi:hypothetical protein
MAHRIPEADTTPESSTPRSREANPLKGEHDQLQSLCRRLETAAAALIRLRDRLQAHASECRGCDEDREHDHAEAGDPEPGGGRR